MGPVHVGVRSKAQVRHCGDGPGLLGAAIWAAISEGPQRLTQSPEQGGGCCLVKLFEICWPWHDQLMAALSSAAAHAGSQVRDVDTLAFCLRPLLVC